MHLFNKRCAQLELTGREDSELEVGGPRFRTKERKYVRTPEYIKEKIEKVGGKVVLE